MKKLVLATKNLNKLKEINDLFTKLLDIEVVLPDDDFDVEETGATFIENAVLKAKAASLHMNLPALADDSGLSVDALEGRPGVFSARYEKTDELRIERILKELKQAESSDKSARFICAMALVDADGEIIFSAEENCCGEIIEQKQGSNGFGYDPVFYIKEMGKTMAELTLDEKNTLSHRSKALNKVIDFLKNLNS